MGHVDIQQSAHLGDAFLNRVKQSYHLAMAKFAGTSTDMWSGIDTMRRPVHEALMAPDNAALRVIFANPITTDLFYGVDNLAKSIEILAAAQPGIDEYISHRESQQIVTLASALGLIRWVPESGEGQFVNFHNGPMAKPIPGLDSLLADIERKLGFAITFPNPFPGERGAATSRGTASARAIMAIYQAFRLQQEAPDWPHSSILEIGPGTGRTAYYAANAGCTRYTTIDLPMGVVAQACFLGATLGPDAIWLHGDTSDAGNRIRLLPCTDLETLEDHFNVVLNVDSLTEMGREPAAGYAAWIAGHTDSFLSINHEANEQTVASLAQHHLPAARHTRFPCWMREGYSEEIFQIAGINRSYTNTELANLRTETSSWHQTRRRLTRLTLRRLGLSRSNH
jgi:hypothetical protein